MTFIPLPNIPAPECSEHTWESTRDTVTDIGKWRDWHVADMHGEGALHFKAVRMWLRVVVGGGEAEPGAMDPGGACVCLGHHCARQQLGHLPAAPPELRLPRLPDRVAAGDGIHNAGGHHLADGAAARARVARADASRARGARWLQRLGVPLEGPRVLLLLPTVCRPSHVVHRLLTQGHFGRDHKALVPSTVPCVHHRNRQVTGTPGSTEGHAVTTKAHDQCTGTHSLVWCRQLTEARRGEVRPLDRLSRLFHRFFRHADFTSSDLAVTLYLASVTQRLRRRRTISDLLAASGPPPAQLLPDGSTPRRLLTASHAASDLAPPPSSPESLHLRYCTPGAAVSEADMAEAEHYAPFAMAAYGSLYFMYTNPQPFRLAEFLFGGCCPQLAGGGVTPRGVLPKPGDVMNKAAICGIAGIPRESLVYVNTSNAFNEHVPYFVALDAERRTVVIGIRGTLRCAACRATPAVCVHAHHRLSSSPPSTCCPLAL